MPALVMKKFLGLPILTLILIIPLGVLQGQERTRLIICADMGNEPDEMQQMAHMLACSNEFDLEGLIAVTGKFLRPNHHQGEYKSKVHPELFIELIDAYEKVLPNLKKHAGGWHEPEYLRSIVKAGQPGYGIRDVGEGNTSEGAQLILDAIAKEDPRPIWVVVNAGSNTLAQALYVIKTTQSADVLRKAVAKLRVYENGSQDNAGAWIASEFPEIHWIRSNYQTYAYGGPGGKSGGVNENLGPHQWKPFAYSSKGQAEWTWEHIQKNHGALGAAYPDRSFRPGHYAFKEGGGTIPWMGLVNKGLFDINQPSWGGWSGRFTEKKVAGFWSRHGDIRPDEEVMAPFYVYREASDYWVDPQDGQVYEGDYVPIWRFRPAMYADFAARMDWCVRSYADANHHPVAAVDGDASDAIIRLKATPGEHLSFDASASSDPDGDDLEYNWWIYQEAGSYSGKIAVENDRSARASLTIPTGARNEQVHLILELRDKDQEVALTDYRRIVIDVSDYEPWSNSPQKADKERFDLMPIPR